MSFMKMIKKASKALLVIAPALIAAASVITAATPSPVDDGVVMAVHKLLDAVALNEVGHNAEDRRLCEEDK